MKFKLSYNYNTYNKIPAEIELTLEELGGNMLSNIERYKGYSLPESIYPFLAEKIKKAWHQGWRGYLHYFSKGGAEERERISKELLKEYDSANQK